MISVNKNVWDYTMFIDVFRKPIIRGCYFGEFFAYLNTLISVDKKSLEIDRNVPLFRTALTPTILKCILF